MTVIRKLVWFALWVAVAIAALGFETDREARHNASLAEYVPTPFRGFALEVLARGDFARGDDAAGMQLAREMVARRPIPAEGMAMVAQGELAEGRERPALAAVMVAAERGWRDSFTQAALVQLAVQGGDWDIAAQRLLALWRKGENNDELRVLSGAVLSRKEGLRAFNAQLRAEAGWSNALLLWSADTLDASLVRSLAHTLRRQHAQLDCSLLSVRAISAIRRGRGDVVDALWQAACSGTSNGVVTRGLGTLLFTPTDGLVGPFDWSYPVGLGVVQEVSRAGGETILHFSNSEIIRQPIARRMVLLPSGEHFVRAEGGAVTPSEDLTLLITCFDRDGRRQTIGKFTLTRESRDFNISAACVSQMLEIEAGSGSGSLSFIRID
ncbi:hypothetical protein [Novosphingobium sp. KA1]|uniref:hypothetical protein n=1 Tax=Novosphingobium sp. (strain KA1) TaxID=164608 RepID=UPI001A8D05CA|nr:hypothetical protein [Novosphingobium sp. KA1]QSR18993.1 hypothetical protein CA833_0045 [Novosphingobium sp. KA1]